MVFEFLITVRKTDGFTGIFGKGTFPFLLRGIPSLEPAALVGQLPGPNDLGIGGENPFSYVEANRSSTDVTLGALGTGGVWYC